MAQPATTTPTAGDAGRRGWTRLRRRRALGVWLSGLLVVVATAAPVATAAQPTIQRFDIDETSADEFLTEACAVPVTTRARGHVILRPLLDGGTGTVIPMIVGQIPPWVHRRLEDRRETGDVILEPHHSLEERIEEAWAALTA